MLTTSRFSIVRDVVNIWYYCCILDVVNNISYNAEVYAEAYVGLL